MTDLAYRQSYSLPRGYGVEFALSNGRLECQWSPDVPRGKVARRLLPEYRKARANFLGSLGLPTVVIEL